LQSGRYNAALILQELQEKEQKKKKAPTGVGAQFLTGSSLPGTYLPCQEENERKRTGWKAAMAGRPALRNGRNALDQEGSFRGLLTRRGCKNRRTGISKNKNRTKRKSKSVFWEPWGSPPGMANTHA
jgi:hypothetical protein